MENVTGPSSGSANVGGARRQLLSVSQTLPTDGTRDRSPRRPTGDGNESNQLPLRDDELELPTVPSKRAQAILQEELGNSLPATVMKDLRRVTQKFMDKAEKLQSTIAMIEKLKAEIRELEAGRIPRSCRQFGFGFETEMLDLPCGSVMGDTVLSHFSGEEELKITLHAGVTYRSAKLALHRAQLLDHKRLDLTVAEAHRLKLVRLTTFKAFQDSCNAVTNVTDSAIHSLGLEIEDDLWKDDMPPKLEAQIIKIYKRTIEALGKARVEKEMASRRESAAKDKVLENLKKEKPVDLLEHLVDERIDTRLKAKSKTKAKGKKPIAKFDINYKTLVEGAVNKETLDYDAAVTPAQQSSKNPTSPAAEGAQLSAAKAKGRGKGKPSPKPKAKPKAKAGKGDSQSLAKSSKGKGGKPKGRGKGKRD